MLLKNLKYILYPVILVILCLANLPAFAVTPHEDPEVAKTVFSGIALFDYYAETIDMVLQKKPDEVTARMSKMPFANVPPFLEKACGDMTDSLMSLSVVVVNTEVDLENLKSLLTQARLAEAFTTVNTILKELATGRFDEARAESSAMMCGDFFNVLALSELSPLRVSYDNLLTRLGQVSDLLQLYQDMLASLLQGIVPSEWLTDLISGKIIDELVASIQSGQASGQLLPQNPSQVSPGNPAQVTPPPPEQLIPQLSKYADNPAEFFSGKPLISTQLILNVNPTDVFVGDNIRLWGSLKSGDNVLAGREVQILLDNARTLVTRTDANGNYEATLAVPFRYTTIIQIQALYSPQDEDTGIYMASLSQVVKLNVIFYKASVVVQLEKKAYPGRETMIGGTIDYGAPLPPEERLLEIYFNNVLVYQTSAIREFTYQLKLDTLIDVGEHLVTVSISADKRYAPSVGEASLTVVKAVPEFTGRFPAVVIIPGSFTVSGEVHSEIGVLKQAEISLNLGKPQVITQADDNGTFSARLGTRMGFSLIGEQLIALNVTPTEPWNASLYISQKVIVINVVNCGGLLLLMVISGILAPRKLQIWFGRLRRKRSQLPAPVTTRAELAPVYSEAVTVPVNPRIESKDTARTIMLPRDRTFFLYRVLVKLAEKIARVLLKPQQTLREFAMDVSKSLGPVGVYFLDFTKVIERLLYSPREATERDVERGEQLSEQVKRGLKE